jgi:DNA ligase 1
MPDIADGETVEIQGSASLPYILKNIGGVYSCSCPAWRNQSLGIERRTCKHLRQYRGEAAEAKRLGSQISLPTTASSSQQVPALLLAQTYEPHLSVRGWWISEKLDGVRAYWDGQQFWSRQGNRYHAPDWFCERLPNQPLDGELWLDRRAFQRTVSIVRRQDQNEQWRKIIYVVFDAPAIQQPFEQRQLTLADLVQRANHPYLQRLAQVRCRSQQHLQDELLRIEQLGGEGLMLRQPGSAYEVGRSATLLKLKSFHEADAQVVSHLPGQGRHHGRLGALLVALPNGIQFAVGSGLTDDQREHPPQIGSLISFRYQELTDRGVPRFPTFLRERTDLVSAQ